MMKDGRRLIKQSVTNKKVLMEEVQSATDHNGIVTVHIATQLY